MRFDMGGVESCTIPVNQTGLIGCFLHHLEQALPGTIARPAYKSIVASLPRSVAWRDVTPTRARAQTPEDAIDDASMLNISMAASWIGRQVGFQLTPLLFGKVSSAHRRLTFLI